MKKSLLLIAFTLCIVFTYAQSHSADKVIGVNTSYIAGNGLYPGLKFGVEYPLMHRLKVNDARKKGTKRTLRQFLVGADLGLIIQPQNSTTTFLVPEFSYRKTRTKGFKIGFGLGGGIARTFIGETYSIEDNELIKIKAAGSAYFMTTFHVMLGYDFFPKRKSNISWHLKPGIYMLTPFNNTTIPNLSLETGVIYHFNKKQPHASF